jgi:parvulin-like peptidyl-prolyl isomerase
MRLRYWYFPLIGVILAISWLSGCSDSGDKVLATVGGYEITMKEFEDFARQLNRPYPTAEDEFNDKRDVLDTMIVNRLLAQGAYEKGIDQLEEIARVVLANKDKFLLDVLYQRKIKDKVDIAEAELKEFYNNLEYKIRVSHIVTNTLDTAEMLLERVMDGENFEQLAYDYSVDQSAKRNRGDLGYFTWGAMVDEFQEVAFQMEPGEISPPVKTKFGYHIIKLVDKQPNEARDDYSKMKPSLKSQLMNLKLSRKVNEFMETIQDKYRVTIDTNTVQYVNHKREELYPPQVIPNLPKNDFDIEQLDRDERELVLATWDGGQLTLYQYLTDVRQIPAQFRPDLDDYEALADVIFKLKTNDFLILEANRAGLENDPEFKRKLQLFKDLSMAEVMRNDSIPQPLPPDDAMVRQYYEERLDRFTDPPQVHVYEILLSDEILATRLAKEIKTLEKFKEKAAELTERPAKRGSNGDLGFIERKWFPEVFDLAKKTDIGSIGGPVVTSGGKYSIFWVVDKVPESVKDYLSVKPQIIQLINHEQKQKAVEKWIDERMNSTEIVVNEDVLWETIDMDKYAAVDTENPENN